MPDNKSALIGIAGEYVTRENYGKAEYYLWKGIQADAGDADYYIWLSNVYVRQNKIADGRRGLGLGLALCKAIVEAHGGSITLTDNHPTGCRFTFSLPVEEVNFDE